MESVTRLRTLLLRAIGRHGSPQSELELFDELMVQKPDLLHLYNVGQRSQQQQKEIESGKITIHGRTIALNAEFTRQVLFLSQQLNCSERCMAEIMHTVMFSNPNLGSAEYLEAVVAEFLQRRRHLVDILRYLFDAAEVARNPEAPTILQRLENFVRTQLSPSSIPRGSDISLTTRIFKEIDGLGAMISQADNARKNATSNTVTPSSQGNSPSLGYDILNARYESLKYERKYLAIALCTISRLGYVSANEVKLVVDWLSLNPNNAVTFYLLTMILTTLDPGHPQSPCDMMRKELALDKSTQIYMCKKLATSTEWKEPGLKATILLQWTLFLTEIRHREPGVENREGFGTEELEMQIWNAVQGDAFKYLSQAILQLQRGRASYFGMSSINNLMPSIEQQEQRDVPPDDFKPIILTCFETLVRSLITHASSELRKIKQRQEDLVLANARSDRSRASNNLFASTINPTSDKSASQSRNDIAMLYLFMGLLYSSLPPERALQFWGAGAQNESQRTSYLEYTESTAGKLPAFLQWAVWSSQIQDHGLLTALYTMLTGLANGQQCSELAYNFMARGSGEVIPGSVLPSSTGTGQAVSWSLVFGLLDSWAAPAPATKSHSQPSSLSLIGSHTSSHAFYGHQQSNHQHPHQPNISPPEVLLAQSFLRLLSTVVTHSVAVRTTISGHAHFHAIPTLVSLIPLGVPLELKGAIFDCLASFCEPGAGNAGVEICKAVWTLMERMEVINVRAGASGGIGTGFHPVKGVEVELEEVETAHKMYPATIPFLRLLCALIHTPKRIHLKDRLADSGLTNTIPETLGQPYRLPGIRPFVTFIVDNVFLNIPNRDYLRLSERWQINDLCLSFIERVLASYPLESLVTAAEDSRLKEGNVVPLLVHPGYDLLTRLLTGSQLQTSLLSYIVDGVEGFEKGFADDEPYFRATIIRVMRIVHRVLEIQDIFLDVLVPLLSEFNSVPLAGVIHPRSYFTRFDQALSFGPHYVPALAAYVAYPSHPELALLSVKIITLLSMSSALPNLTTLVERSGDSERILNGFRQILAVETMEDVSVAEASAEQYTGAGASDLDDVPVALEQAVRLSVLDLFIKNTEPGRPFPNIAHFLLFGGTSNDQNIQDPHALGAHTTCIHVILSMLGSGVPRLKTGGKDVEEDAAALDIPLFINLPSLAERCYRVIYLLCMHPRTYDFTMRYLRTREDFFARQLAAMPSKVPSSWQEPGLQVIYHDGSRVTTTVSTLSSFLQLRALIFELVALDIHLLIQKGHFKAVGELLAILFGTNSFDEPIWESDILHSFHEIGQSHLRIMEYLRALVFEWSDGLTVQPIDIKLLGHLNLHTCLRLDQNGCEIVDSDALLTLLGKARQALHAQGTIVTPAHLEQLEVEVNYVLKSSAVENHRRQVDHAVANAYQSWRRLLDVVLVRCFDRLPHTERENTLFDLMHFLPSIIRSPGSQGSTAILLAETILSSITKLREDRRHQQLIESITSHVDASSLPVERLFTIVQGVLDCILDSDRVELVRGNLYAALVNYVQLVTKSDTDTAQVPQSDRAQTSAVDTFSSLTMHIPSVRNSSTSLESGSLALMKNVADPLIAMITRDTIDGTEVWKTIAFILLDSLVLLSSREKHDSVLTALSRYGIMSNFVRGVKDSDLLLQSMLKPDPDDLNPLYVYEAKFSLFIRMAQTRAGAERLLDAHVISVLAQCDYLDARPEIDQSFMDRDSFLPSAVQRYHQLLTPALQLLCQMLGTLGSKHATVSHQVLDFLSNHSATIVILIKTDPDNVPLVLLQELHLLVSLCSSVLPHVPKSELASFGAIHAAILSLSTVSLPYGWWTQNVKPQTDAEMTSASRTAPGPGSLSLFEADVRQNERLLRKSIISYLGTASDFTESEITLVVSPVTKATRFDERSPLFTASVPTIGDVIEALEDIHNDLSDTFKQIADLTAEVTSGEHLAVDNIHTVSDMDELTWQELDMGQKQALIRTQFQRLRNSYQKESRTLIGAMEMLLLVLWRHVVQYGEEHQTHHPKLSASTIYAMRFVSIPEAGVFRSEVGRKITPLLQRLETLELHQELLGHDPRPNTAYLEIMCRRLRDTFDLHGNGPPPINE